MKGISVLLTAMMIFMVGAIPMNSVQNEVVLNASQVTGAPDIENAINLATNNGTQTGTVTLDSSAGDFIFTDIDRSVNIFVPNLTLRSENGAVIRNCADGIYFDGLNEDGVTIEGITFNCDGSGVVSVYEHKDIVIRDSTFNVANTILNLQNANDWKFVGNTGSAPTVYAGMMIVNSNNLEISDNQLEVYQGISLYNSNNNIIVNNNIYATGDAIWLNASSYNRVARNHIMSTQFAGIHLAWDVENNKIMGNQVKCSSGFQCQAVSITEPASSDTNKINNNKLLPDEPPLSFETTLVHGWNTFILGPSSGRVAYIADITPLEDSVDGAHIPFTIKPVYDGEQWNDVLFAFIPAEQPDQKVRITVYDLNGLLTIKDMTETFLPAELHTPIIFDADTVSSYALLSDVDPLNASVNGATFKFAQIYPEFKMDKWWSTVRLQTEDSMPSNPLDARIRVYTAPYFMELASEFNYDFTKDDLWTGFYIGPASLERGYVVQMTPLSPTPGFRIAEYRIQPEFNGYVWNDVLRVHIENTDETQQYLPINIKIFACDTAICQ